MSVKLESSTRHADASLAGDGSSVIFQRKNSTEQVFWPVRDWDNLDRFVRSQIEAIKIRDKDAGGIDGQAS